MARVAFPNQRSLSELVRLEPNKRRGSGYRPMTAERKKVVEAQLRGDYDPSSEDGHQSKK